jgi:hypothetical protein
MTTAAHCCGESLMTGSALQPGGSSRERDLGEVGIAGEQDQFVAACVGEGGHGVSDLLW